MRRTVVTVVIGTVLAVGIPTTWALTRPSTAVGPTVEQALQAAPTSTPDPTVASPLPSVPARPATPVTTAAPPAPILLTVPAAGIDAPVDPVGVEPDGSMTIPEDIDRVGWYSYGSGPASPEGTIVLAGHVDSATAGLGAMAPLRTVEVGDPVTVTDAAGTTTTWRVSAREEFDKRELPVEELFARDGAPRLVLITCGGEFLADVGSYADNVVVIAEPA